MKFLIAGLGSIGRRHLRNLQILGERDIILYRTHRGMQPDDDYSEFQVETDLKTALDHDLDAVIVSNPTSLHLEVAIPAARRGCDLLVEKPISHNLASVSELTAVVRDEQVNVLVGYQYRFHPSIQKMNELIKSGVIGRPLSTRSHWGEYLPNWHPWEDYRKGYSARTDLGGGVILTLSHPLDYLRWLFGEVEEVWASSGSYGDLELDVEDTAEISLLFLKGMIGSVHLDYNQQPPNHHLEVIGTDGTIQWNNSYGTVRWYQSDNNEWQTWSTSQKFERNEMFLAQMRHFLAVVRGEINPVCSLDDGIQALRIALAALESGQSKKLVRLVKA
jgi:predicted dehydrogenase